MPPSKALFVGLAVAAFPAEAGKSSTDVANLPLTKVIKMLESMSDELQEEQKNDKDMRAKMVCWCETNKKEKTQAVEDAKATMTQLQNTIEAASGAKGASGATADNLKKELAENRAALKTATEVRDKEAKDFHEQEKNMLAAVKLLEGAITALSKHTPGFLQSDTALEAVKPELRKLVHQNLDLTGWLKDSPSKDAFMGFLDAHDDILEPDTFLQEASSSDASGPFKSYGAQSGPITGILKQMKEDFEHDLPEIQGIEQKKSSEFAELKASKLAEISEQEATMKQKWQENADTRLDLVAAKDDLEDTKKSYEADTAFLLEVQKRCTESDKDYEIRQQTRTDEIAAVSGAIKILSTDEIREAQQTTFGFLQVSSQRRLGASETRLTRALDHLKKVAHNKPEILSLISLAMSDPFGKVVEAIDKLVQKLKQQQADEVKHRDFCVDSLNENEIVTQRKNTDLSRLEADINQLNDHHKRLTNEVAELKSEIAQLEVDLQRASENRKAENMLFQKNSADAVRTQEALAKAYAKLEEFYSVKHVFLQTNKGPDADAYFNSGAPDAGTYQENEKGTGVMGMMKKMQGEAKIMEDEAVHDEGEAQAAYESMIGETNSCVKEKSRLIADKTEEMATVDKTRQEKTIDKEDVLGDLQGLSDEKADLLGQCTFLMDNFDLRQDSRAEEMDALGEVKGILSGMQGAR